MNDTPGRKNPSRFEPPPWEKEQFDELAKKKAAEGARIASEQQVQQAQAEAKRKSEEDTDRRLQEVAECGDGETVTDMGQMMVLLQAEEPSSGKGLWKAGVISGTFLAFVGAIFMVWGIVAMRVTQGAGSVGQLGAGILMFFGIGFIAIAAWTIQRSLRQRGAS